jgi:hypothetical protein
MGEQQRWQHPLEAVPDALRNSPLGGLFRDTSDVAKSLQEEQHPRRDEFTNPVDEIDKAPSAFDRLKENRKKLLKDLVILGVGTKGLTKLPEAFKAGQAAVKKTTRAADKAKTASQKKLETIRRRTRLPYGVEKTLSKIGQKKLKKQLLEKRPNFHWDRNFDAAAKRYKDAMEAATRAVEAKDWIEARRLLNVADAAKDVKHELTDELLNDGKKQLEDDQFWSDDAISQMERWLTPGTAEYDDFMEDSRIRGARLARHIQKARDWKAVKEGQEAYEKYLKTKAEEEASKEGLPMDTPSRYERAGEMGFGKEIYYRVDRAAPLPEEGSPAGKKGDRQIEAYTSDLKKVYYNSAEGWRNPTREQIERSGLTYLASTEKGAYKASQSVDVTPSMYRDIPKYESWEKYVKRYVEPSEKVRRQRSGPIERWNTVDINAYPFESGVSPAEKKAHVEKLNKGFKEDWLAEHKKEWEILRKHHRDDIETSRYARRRGEPNTTYTTRVLVRAPIYGQDLHIPQEILKSAGWKTLPEDISLTEYETLQRAIDDYAERGYSESRLMKNREQHMSMMSIGDYDSWERKAWRLEGEIRDMTKRILKETVDRIYFGEAPPPGVSAPRVKNIEGTWAAEDKPHMEDLGGDPKMRRLYKQKTRLLKKDVKNIGGEERDPYPEMFHPNWAFFEKAEQVPNFVRPSGRLNIMPEVLERLGYTASRVIDEAGTSTAVFDPSAIRHTGAAFNPAHKSSSRISAGVATLAATGAALLTKKEKKRLEEENEPGKKKRKRK